MNTKKIREELGRAKICIMKRDYERAIYLFCSALKEIGKQQAPIDLRGDIRTMVSDLCSSPLYKSEYQQAIVYQPGKEYEILIFFYKFYKKIINKESSEEYEQTIARKLKIDRCIQDGKVFLSQGKINEADLSFEEAIKNYRDEFAIFPIIAKALQDAGNYVRAIGFAKRGLQIDTDNEELKQIIDYCAKERAKLGR